MNAAAGKQERIQWVAERPTRRQGAWGLGCSVCAFALCRLEAEGSLRARACKARVATKWARFEVRCRSLQASALSLHAESNGHKLALHMFCCPDAPVREVICDSAANLSDMELLRGSVPQPCDWLRAWRYLKEGISFHGAAKLSKTEQHIEQQAAGPAASRVAIQALQRVMVEVTRDRKRAHLRQASAIAICVDDRNGFKLARFRCDHASGARVGLLGIVRRTGGVTPLESFEEDFSERDAETIRHMVKSFCTSMTGDFDQALFGHIVARIEVYVSDGDAGALKSGRILKERLFKNIAFFVRDPAHAVRIAGRDPLHADIKFGEFCPTLRRKAFGLQGHRRDFPAGEKWG